MENYVQQSEGTSIIKRGSFTNLATYAYKYLKQNNFIYKLSSLILRCDTRDNNTLYQVTVVELSIYRNDISTKSKPHIFTKHLGTLFNLISFKIPLPNSSQA